MRTCRFLPPACGLVALAVLLHSGCFGRTDRLPAHAPTATGAALRSIERPLPPDVAPPPLTLAAGDVVDVQLIGQPGTVELCTIAPDGRLYFHAGQSATAAGQTPEAVATALAAELRGLYRMPRVHVGPRQLASQQATVLGAVRQPGSIPLSGGERVLDLIAAARGLAEGRSTDTSEELAELSAAIYVRAQQALPVDLAALMRGDARHNIRVHPGDYLYVPSRTNREVEVLGAVPTPRPVPWRGDLTISRAIAAAGGLTKDTYLDRVVLLRRTGGHHAGLVDVRAILEGRAGDVPLLARDVIYLPGRTAENPRFMLDRFNTAFVQSVTTRYADDIYQRLIQPRVE